MKNEQQTCEWKEFIVDYFSDVPESYIIVRPECNKKKELRVYTIKDFKYCPFCNKKIKSIPLRMKKIMGFEVYGK